MRSNRRKNCPLTLSVSAPVVEHISFLNIYNGGQESTFGVFGYCTNIQVGLGPSSSPSLSHLLAKVQIREIDMNSPEPAPAVVSDMTSRPRPTP
jgi:hypothetical protein